jgi:hypothetical protein
MLGNIYTKKQGTNYSNISFWARWIKDEPLFDFPGF